MTTDRKAILLGIDGATFDLLGPWLDEGHLPHLRRLCAEGACGELESTRPPTTAPAWVACVTGVNPGQHGVFDFRESPLLDPNRPLISSQSVRAPTLWQILNHHRREVGLLNVPITYPPEAVEGFIVGGMMSPGPESRYAHPPELRDELNARGYVIDVEIQKYDVEAESDAMRFLDDVEEALLKRAEVLVHLMETRRWDFLMAVFVAADRIQHLFWKTLADSDSSFFHAPRAPLLRERILAIYKVIDRVVGDLMARVDADGAIDLFVVSDHGFGSTKTWFNVNRWLEREGHLFLKPLSGLRKRAFYEAMKINDSPTLKALLPKSLGRVIRGKVRSGRSVFKTDLDSCIDWRLTRAFFASIPSQGIYIHIKRDGAGTVEPGEEYEAVRGKIRSRLLRLVDPRDGEPLVDQVWFREELYHGPQAHLAPDLLFVARDYSVLGRELLGTRGIVETSMNWPNGFHRMNGVIMAYGPRAASGVRVEGARMIDVAPTILHCLGLPVPANMDGRVLIDLLDPGCVGENPILFEAPLNVRGADVELYSEEESSEITDRLAALGYLE